MSTKAYTPYAGPAYAVVVSYGIGELGAVLLVNTHQITLEGQGTQVFCNGFAAGLQHASGLAETRYVTLDGPLGDLCHNYAEQLAKVMA